MNGVNQLILNSAEGELLEKSWEVITFDLSTSHTCPIGAFGSFFFFVLHFLNIF